MPKIIEGKWLENDLRRAFVAGKNKEQRTLYSKIYYENHKEEKKAIAKAWYEANLKKAKRRRKGYYETNPDKAKRDANIWREPIVKQ